MKNVKYDNVTKNLRIEKVKVHNKKSIDEEQMNIYSSGIGMNRLMVFHQSTSDALAHFFHKHIAKNMRLKGD